MTGQKYIAFLAVMRQRWQGSGQGEPEMEFDRYRLNVSFAI